MGVRESLLNTITSVADSDFVRIVTSAGASSKATVRNLFKGFESNLGAKSSLTTSDYIRVVGSDNEAYKQGIANVLEAFGINGSNPKLLTANDDLDNITAVGYYYTLNTDIPSNAPMTDAYNSAIIVLHARGGDVFQIYGCNNKDTWWWRTKLGSTWRGWRRIPYGSEVDALKRKADKKTAQTVYSVSARTINAHSGSAVSVPLTIPSGYHLVGNVNAYCTGVVGLIAGFDGNAYNANPVPVYINNTTNGNITITNNLSVRIISLFEKD